MNIRQVGNKIKSTGNVRKITKAMQLVSAVKMKKAQAAAHEGAPYQEFLERSIRRMSQKVDPAVSPLLHHSAHAHHRKLVILVSSNKGLCGSFNTNLVRFVLNTIDLKNTDFIIVGKKGGSLVASLGGAVIADYSASNPFVSVAAVFDQCVNSFLNNSYSSVSVAYNRFVSALRYIPTEEKILPFALSAEMKAQEPSREYLIEPDASLVMQELLKNYIEEKIRFCIVQNEAGEHSARMVAMKNATDNAGELIDGLTLLRNKLRQQKITYELLDMITAKESVEVS
jgi:F-type H+-transporting ATPase subunit gamma